MDSVEEDIEGKEHLVTSDSVPSSSTDADLNQTNTGSINEDAISSTSADPESCKVLYPDVNQFAAGLSAQDINLIIMGQPASSDEKKGSPSTADSDFLELNMSGTITENITEDVEDIVQDLENLLGESTDSFSLVKNRKTMENVGKEEESRSSSNDAIDPFTMFENQLAERERQILKERNEALCSPEIDSPKDIIESTKPDETSESVETQDVSDVQSIQPSQIVEETTIETAAEPQKEELTVSGSTFETNIETPQTNTELQIDLVETKNVELEHGQDENIDQVEKNEEKISVQLEPGHDSVVSPKCDPVIETSPVLQHEPSIIQDSENAKSEEVLTLVSNIDTTNLNEGDTVASFSSIVEEQNVEAVDDKEETDQQSVYCSSSQITNESKDSSEITDSQELEEHRSRFKEDVNVDMKQCDSEEIENEDTTIEAEKADQLDTQFTNQTETTTEESINEIDSNTNLVSSQIDDIDSNLESSKMDVDELDEMKENTEKLEYRSTSYDVTPMEVDQPFDYGANDDNKTHEEIEESVFEDAPAICSLETIQGNIDDDEMENILYSNVISNEPENTESTDKIDDIQNKDETDLAVESLGMILQDKTVGNEYEENEEINAVIEEDNTATEEETPFQATSPLVQENVDADLNAREVTENTSGLSENVVIEESSQIQEETNRDFINDARNMQETLEETSEGVGDDDDNEMQMSSTTPEESCSNAQVVNPELEENKISDIDESVHEAEQISEINSASNNTQEIDELCDSIEAAKVEKESSPVAGTSQEEANEEEPPIDEIEKSQNKLTLEAVESLVNYEFEENFISSSDGGKSYSNATQESLPYEIQENVPVSSSGSNYIESSSSSFCENTEDIPKEIIEEANVEDVSRADSAEKSDDQSNDDVESSTEKEEPEQKISIRIKTNQTDHSDVKTPLLISIEGENASETNLLNEENVLKGVAEREESRGPLKMTITKQADSTHSILKIFNPSENESEESIEAESKPCEQSVPKLIIKPVQKPDSDQPTIPKITIKPIQPPPECSTGHLKMPESNVDVNNPLKMTIRSPAKPEQNVSPKLTIKPLTKPETHEMGHHSPRITIKPIVKSPEEIEQVHSPRLTIKPIVKPIDESKMMELEKFGTKLTIKPLVKPRDEPEVEVPHGPRLTIKPVVKPHDETKSNVEQVHSPRLTIKPIVKPSEEAQKTEQHSPRITIKPVVKPDANEPVHSPKITIKPILRPEEIEVTPTPKITIKPIMRSESEQSAQSPRITIKPPVKPPNPVEIIEIQDDDTESNKKVPSPKITIKPVGKPPNKSEIETIDLVDYEDEIKQERIVLKINKNTIPGGSRENPKKQEDAGNEKLGKLRLKFSREGRRAHIVTPRNVLLKRSLPSDAEHGTQKRLKTEQSSSSRQSGKEQLHTKLKQILSSSFVGHISGEKMPGEFQVTKDKPATTIGGMEISVVDKPYTEEKDPLADIPVFEISPETIATVVKPPVVDLTSDNASELSMETSVPVAPPPPRKRGRPRKVPLVVREEFKDPKEETPPEPPPPQEHYDSGRPKRSCRGPSVRMTLGIKPRKPRGPGRGRGGKRGMGTRPAPMKPVKEPKLSAAKLKLLKALKEPEKEIEEKDVIEEKVEPDDTPEVVIYEEETRMSADSSSRAQTPAKQVISSSVEIEESQSSFQSSATTESVKVRKGPRLEVHQEPEGAVISAEQLAEYSWGGGGPYMLQEQVAQFLGIKSFKRKYPGIKRRPLEMQERDFIRESGLASEAMCDLGLTAVNSADILDIMYSDFQHKYEEYCKHQRDRQAKDLTNKQKALSLAAKQENNKIDITEQAIQSAASWNSTFNKARREERKAFVDLQTFTIQYPKGKMKQINKEKVGNYPVALVPGQFTDWYKTFTPTELNNLPLNTMCYDAININNNIVPQDMDDSQSDCSMSDSDSSSSDSDSSDSGSSEDCNMCSPAPVLKHATAVW